MSALHYRKTSDSSTALDMCARRAVIIRPLWEKTLSTGAELAGMHNIVHQTGAATLKSRNRVLPVQTKSGRKCRSWCIGDVTHKLFGRFIGAWLRKLRWRAVVARMSRGRGQNLEAEAREFRGRGQKLEAEAEAEAEAKFLTSRPVWPRGYNISASSTDCDPDRLASMISLC